MSSIYTPFCGITLFIRPRSTETTRRSNQAFIVDNSLCLYTTKRA